MGAQFAEQSAAEPVQPDAALAEGILHNRDVDWNRWPVQTYLEENYRQPHAADLAVIEHHARFYRALAPGSVERSLEFGAGPNLYPLMLAASVSRSIHAVEPSAASIDYLRRQLSEGADASWSAFYQECRRLLPTLPPDLNTALSIVEVSHGSATDVADAAYDLASMHFVAESITEDLDEFEAMCARFARAVRPGCPIVAAFMENMGRYHLGDGSTWPGVRVDSDVVRAAFARHATGIEVTRIDADATLPDYGYTGMVLMTARRPAHAEP